MFADPSDRDMSKAHIYVYELAYKHNIPGFGSNSHTGKVRWVFGKMLGFS